jgi:hypothetical protein
LHENIEKYHENFQVYVKAQEREKEEERRQHEKEKEEERQQHENERAPIYQWETCSRLAQGQ